MFGLNDDYIKFKKTDEDSNSFTKFLRESGLDENPSNREDAIIKFSVLILNSKRNKLLCLRHHGLDENKITIPTVTISLKEEFNEFEVLKKLVLDHCMLEDDSTLKPIKFTHLMTRDYLDDVGFHHDHKYFRIILDCIPKLSCYPSDQIQNMTVFGGNVQVEMIPMNILRDYISNQADEEFYTIQPGLEDALKVYFQGYDDKEHIEPNNTTIEHRHSDNTVVRILDYT